MASNGMNVARLNLSHGTHAEHQEIIGRIRNLNKDKGYSVAIMMDTEGSEVHLMALAAPVKAAAGQEFTFTVRDPAGCSGPVIAVSYDGFTEDMRPGDMVVVDGGMVSLEVVSKAGPDVLLRTVDPGIILSRANLTFRRNNEIIRASNSSLPVISAKVQ